ncbi:MAG: hydrogenase maturation protease [Ignavibacteria bacterium]|nr:hydrogenase maturation protease [Ignavibacteria bacterium]
MDEILVIAIGNDIIGDDGAAFVVADELKKLLPESVCIEKIYTTGLDIIELIEGKRKVLILDTISTSANPVGTIYELHPEDFRVNHSSSVHYIGLPEVIELCKLIGIQSPEEIKIIALEIEPQYNVNIGLSQTIKNKIPEVVLLAEKVIKSWIEINKT